MNIVMTRRYLADKTVGRLMVEGLDAGATIEDIGRPKGIKIPGETCIPEGEYHVGITQSVKFGRPMILLYTDPKSLACTHEGITFTGIRVHKGATTKQSEGCVLYQGDLPALEAKITAALNKGESVTWNIGRE